MTQPRKKRQATAPAPLAPAQFYITAAQVAALGLDPATAEAVLADAGAVYAQVSSSDMPTPDELAKWASSQWPLDGTPSPIDRLNAALAVLVSLERVYLLG